MLFTLIEITKLKKDAKILLFEKNFSIEQVCEVLIKENGKNQETANDIATKAKEELGSILNIAPEIRTNITELYVDKKLEENDIINQIQSNNTNITQQEIQDSINLLKELHVKENQNNNLAKNQEDEIDSDLLRRVAELKAKDNSDSYIRAILKKKYPIDQINKAIEIIKKIQKKAIKEGGSAEIKMGIIILLIGIGITAVSIFIMQYIKVGAVFTGLIVWGLWLIIKGLWHKLS